MRRSHQIRTKNRLLQLTLPLSLLLPAILRNRNPRCKCTGTRFWGNRSSGLIFYLFIFHPDSIFLPTLLFQNTMNLVQPDKDFPLLDQGSRNFGFRGPGGSDSCMSYPERKQLSQKELRTRQASLKFNY